MNKQTNIMLDLETFGRCAGYGIMSIGATMFTLHPEPKIITTFYELITRESNTAAGLRIDSSTVQFWMEQEGPARAEFDRSIAGEGLPVWGALEEFSRWVGHPHNILMWGNGSDFDNAILATAYNFLGKPQPWEFLGNRCYRTVKEMYPTIKIDRSRGTLHNAIDDATNQTEHLFRIHHHIEGGR